MSMLLRAIAVTAVLCALVFAASFVAGRAARPAVASHELLLPSVPAADAGPAIPERLGSVPAIAVEALPVTKPAAHTNSQPAVEAAAPAKTPAVQTPSAPVSSTPVTPATTTPTPAAKAPATTAPASKAPATKAPPTKAPAAKAPASSGSGGGTSFDSSG
ncbi:MAG TPA: hypothetical protein VK790_08020 [Solirubrobacteraceae bacterium]|jgi:hypothetical protein|nr:hypothetical protein [Solirubrobacteraceae bacterium]